MSTVESKRARRFGQAWLLIAAVLVAGLLALKGINDAHERGRRDAEEAARATREMREQMRDAAEAIRANTALRHRQLDAAVIPEGNEAVPPLPEPPPYSGPIFAPRKDAVKYRVKKTDVNELPPDPNAPPLHSREVPLETLPYFKKKAAERAETLYKMGQGLEKAKKPTAALKYYEQVVEDFPGTSAAEAAEERIKVLRGQ